MFKKSLLSASYSASFIFSKILFNILRSFSIVQKYSVFFFVLDKIKGIMPSQPNKISRLVITNGITNDQTIHPNYDYIFSSLFITSKFSMFQNSLNFRTFKLFNLNNFSVSFTKKFLQQIGKWFLCGDNHRKFPYLCSLLARNFLIFA